MNIVLGHIIGLDEINKKVLTEKLDNDIKIIDLDILQQRIYNQNDIVAQKKNWSSISQKINVIQKQKSLLKKNGGNIQNVTSEIKKLMEKRNEIKKQIHDIWKENISYDIDKLLKKYQDHPVLIIGFNIYPKDYRIKTVLPVDDNKFIFDINSKNYASNQIRFYLQKYSEAIIQGKFPLNLLKFNYLMNKYDKFCDYYHKNNYLLASLDDIIKKINQSKNQNVQMRKQDKPIYVATLYRAGNVIPVNSKTPLNGFLSKEEAIEDIKSQLTGDQPVYIYQINPKQFQVIDNKLTAIHHLEPIDEESVLLTI